MLKNIEVKYIFSWFKDLGLVLKSINGKGLYSMKNGLFLLGMNELFFLLLVFDCIVID